MAQEALARWHQVVRTRDAAALDSLLAETVVFHSPVVHTPQHGKDITARYLAAALTVFLNDSFRYEREFVTATGWCSSPFAAIRGISA
jgi:ketosteroid isomerase-like protein